MKRGALPRQATDETSSVLLGDLLSSVRGISVGVMYPGEHTPDGVPLIRAADLAGNRINSNPDFRISESTHREYVRTELSGGEILMSLVGDVGRCAIVPPSMKGWNAARAIAVIRLKDPEDAAYSRICLLSRGVRHLMDVWSNTTVQQPERARHYRKIEINSPKNHRSNRRRIPSEASEA